jgi:hypothetical protein
MTTLRAMPCGRSGLANGNSPAAMRSVQSPNSPSARSVSSRPMSRAMNSDALPACKRCAQAEAESLKVPNRLLIVRVPGVPSAWQDWQAPLLTMFNHSPWLLIFSNGNSFFFGTLSIENQ